MSTRNQDSVVGRRTSTKLLGDASRIALQLGLGAVVSLPLAALAAPALAQDNPAPDASYALEEVVVTARQRVESLQDTPISIVAVGSESLAKQNVQTTLDLDSRIPSLQIRPDNARITPFIGMRGVGDIARNPGLDNRVGMYLDGAPLGRASVVNYPIFDVENIEVLRGPQGTLFGNNSLTGVIAINSQKPGLEDATRFTVGAGSRHLISGSGYFNTSVGDNIALRATLAGRSQDGYYHNINTGGDLGGGVFFAGRVQVRYTPTDHTTVDLSVDGISARDDILLVVGQQVGGPNGNLGLKDYDVSLTIDPSRVRKLFGGGVNIEQGLPGGFTLTSISSYRTADDKMTYDVDGLPLVGQQASLRTRDFSISQELRLASPENDLFDYVVGAFFYQQNPSSAWVSRYLSEFPTVSQRGIVRRTNTKLQSEQLALFAHGTLRPTDWLALDAGARWQETTKHGVLVQRGGAGAAFADIDFKDSLKDDGIDPMFSVTLTPMKNIHLYALYSTGSRSGGFNLDVIRTATGIEFGPESVTNYEAGLKTTLLDNRLRLNISAYSQAFKDFQVSQTIIPPVGPGQTPTTVVTITNAARVRSRGVEADFDYLATRSLRVSGGIGVNNAFFRSFPNGGGVGIDYTGNRLPEAPRFQASLAATYTHELSDRFELESSVDFKYRSHVYSHPANNRPPIVDNRYLQPAFGTLGARVTLGDQERNLRYSLFARNLLDEQHVDGAAPSATGVIYKTLSEPRTIGFEITLRR